MLNDSVDGFVNNILYLMLLLLKAGINIEGAAQIIYFISEGAYRCIFAMSCGIIAFQFREYIKSVPFIEAFVAVIGLMVLFGNKPNNHLYVVYTAIFSVWVTSLTKSTGGVCHLLSSAPFKYLGKISYSLYLMHVPIIFILLRLKSDNDYMNLCAALIATGVSILVSGYTYSDIELPFIKYAKRRLVNQEK